MSANGLVSTFNYLVPASGTTHGFKYAGVLSADPQSIDFRAQAIDGQPFIPSGVYIDNRLGVDEIVITVVEIDFSFSCPAGANRAVPYPAPIGHTVRFTGNGQATLVFVDFPVLPFDY